MLVRRFVNQMLAAYGTEAFRSEFFFPFSPQSLLTPELQQRPKYEQLGEELVARGVYPEVIRFRQHLLPIYASLREAAFPVAAYVLDPKLQGTCPTARGIRALKPVWGSALGR